MGAGMGLAMAPATEAIMGSLPPAKAGIGSAMNDVVREVGGTLGVAVLGSVLASAYATGWTAPSTACRRRAPRRATASAPRTRSPRGSEARRAELVAAANQAFVDAGWGEALAYLAARFMLRSRMLGPTALQ